MKRVTLRSVVISINVGCGLLSYCLIFGGIRVVGWQSFAWFHHVVLLGLAILLIVGINAAMFSAWVLTPLRSCLSLVKSFGQEYSPAGPQAFRIQELAELHTALQSHHRYLQAVIAAADQVLKAGSPEQALPQCKDDALGQVCQRLLETIETIEQYLQQMIQGRVFVKVPASLQKTRIGDSLRIMRTSLKTIIEQIRKETQHISITGSRIAAMAHQGARNATQETQAIETIETCSQEFAENLREVRQNIKLQSESLDNTFTDIESMLESIEDINTSIEMLSASAEATSHSIRGIHEFMQKIDDYAHSLAQISETVSTEANEGGQSVHEVTNGIRTIQTTVEEAAGAIQQLGHESERIDEILAVINGIAEQTNLLALNASIIAAQTGEHGRGFAVVADEIRDLAERTRSSTHEIAGIIRSLQNGVEQGTVAMNRCLSAVDKGVQLASHSGEVLKKIVNSIQGAREMASTLAEATVTQTNNSQQVNTATEQITQKLDELYTTATNQSKNSTHLAEMANVLREITQHIDQAADAQLEETEGIVHSITDIRALLQRNASITHQLADSSDELGELGSNLAENTAKFVVTPPQLPADFAPEQPTIAFLHSSGSFFFEEIYAGIRDVAAAHDFQTIGLNSQESPVVQAEHLNWLLQQSWLVGIILSPVDEHAGHHAVTNSQQHHLPVAVVDRPVKKAPVLVLSDNQRGGEYAAELLHEVLPNHSTVLVCGSRSIDSIFNRMEGFFKKAPSYAWTVAEVFSPFLDVQQAKQNILEGFQLNSNAKGIFLTNEDASIAYLELLREGKIAPGSLQGVSYDLTSVVADAIKDGRLQGTLFQNPQQIGSIATEELLRLLQQPETAAAASPKPVLVPVKKITRETLRAQTPRAETG
jgi:methyl-accepting chemotaxis protein/ABC-type sugar transport system substrate-binding protein